ncbi:MAG TPA: endonuclease domain-containing protein, partial [Thermoanaerobaculia bacterium]
PRSIPVRTIRSRAQVLRETPTPAEQEMWEILRDRRLRGIKFRRQHPLSIYVADFFCHELKLVIELDGEVHDAPSRAIRDANRDAYLRSLGCTIPRFPNHDLFHYREAVLTRILETATTLRSSHIPPLPPGEGARG